MCLLSRLILCVLEGLGESHPRPGERGREGSSIQVRAIESGILQGD